MNKFLVTLSLTLFFGTVISQHTDFGDFCYPPMSCVDNGDCENILTCVNSTCVAALPGASCTTNSGCSGTITTCRSGKCVLTVGSPYAIDGCTCNNVNQQCPANLKCVSGTCRSGQQSVGDYCQENRDCVQTAYCNGNNNVCVQKLANDDFCGSYGSDWYECLSGYCFSDGNCAARASLNGACTVNSDCASPNYCEYNGTLSNSSCRPRLPNGSPCNLGNSFACASGACSIYSNQTCVAKLLLNDTCNSDSICGSGLCVYGECRTARLALNQTCSGDTDCLSFKCYNNKCMRPFSRAAGEDCDRDSDCSTALCSTDQFCRIPFNHTAGQSCKYSNGDSHRNAECAQNFECTPDDECVAYGSQTAGEACATTSACAAGLYCDDGNHECRNSTNCFWSGNCGLSSQCNCTSEANRTMSCVPTPGKTNYFALGFEDPLRKGDMCYFKYLTPYLIANYPQDCDINEPNFAACEAALVSTYCCALCGADLSLPVGVSPFQYDCGSLKLLNRTQSCNSYQSSVLNCDKFPPTNSTTTTTNTDSPAVRLNAMLMFVLVGIVFVLFASSF